MKVTPCQFVEVRSHCKKKKATSCPFVEGWSHFEEDEVCETSTQRFSRWPAHYDKNVKEEMGIVRCDGIGQCSQPSGWELKRPYFLRGAPQPSCYKPKREL